MDRAPLPTVTPAYVITDYGELVDALRTRRKNIGLSQLELDHRAGWTDGYASKLEMSDAPERARNSRALGRE